MNFSDKFNNPDKQNNEIHLPNTQNFKNQKPTKFLDPKHIIFEKLETKGTRRSYLFVFRKRQEGLLLGSSSRSRSSSSSRG
jgi:hypothetical protein